MAHARALSHAPLAIRMSGPMVNRLLRWGLPLGPNTVVRMHGRVSGRVLDIPLAILEADGHRYLAGTFGETNWVRNLRATPDAAVKVRDRFEPVRAVELSHDEAVSFFRDRIPAYLRAMPAAGRVFGALFLRLAAPEMLSDPELAAARHPVFELLPA